MITRARRWLWPCVHGVVALALLAAAYRALEHLRAAQGSWALAALGLAALVLCLQITVLAVAWGMLLRRAGVPAETSSSLVVKSFVLGWLWRYIPGPPAGPAGKFVVCRGSGQSATHVGSAILYEQVLQLSAMVAIPALSAAFVLGPRAIWLSLPAVVVACGLAALATRRAIVERVMRRIARATGGGHNELLVVPRPPEVAAAGLLLLAAGLLSATSFHLIAISATDWPAGWLGRSMFVIGLASLVGYLIPFLPSGVGAREGVIIALMSPVVGVGGALSIAMISRATAVLVDAALGALVGAFYSGRFVAQRVRLSPSIAAKTRE